MDVTKASTGCADRSSPRLRRSVVGALRFRKYFVMWRLRMRAIESRASAILRGNLWAGADIIPVTNDRMKGHIALSRISHSFVGVLQRTME
jgi:hypothetical protein